MLRGQQVVTVVVSSHVLRTRRVGSLVFLAIVGLCAQEAWRPNPR